MGSKKKAGVAFFLLAGLVFAFLLMHSMDASAGNLDDYGWTSSKVPSNVPAGANLNGVSVCSGGHAWCATYDLGVNLVLYYDGTNWGTQGLDTESSGSLLMKKVFALDPCHAWATGEMYTSGQGNDGPVPVVASFEQEGWNLLELEDENAVVNDVYASSYAEGLCVGTDPDSRCYVGNYDGDDWHFRSLEVTGSLEAVHGCDGEHVWAVGGREAGSEYESVILFYDGSSWTEQKSGWDIRLHDVFARAEDNVWAVGDDGTILFFDGSSWVKQSSGVANKLNGVSGLSEGMDDVFAVGDFGAILISTDGVTWERQAGVTNSNLQDVSALDGNRVWIVGHQGTILRGSKPYIKACSPTGLVQGHEVDLHVLGGGTGFSQSESEAEISGSGIEVEATTVSDGEHATARVKVAADAETASRDVNVVSAEEEPVGLIGGLTIYEAPGSAPVLEDVEPVKARAGLSITLRGTRFGRVRGSSTVTFDGVAASCYYSWSGDRISCKVPTGAKSGPVKVVTPWGDSNQVDFSVEGFAFYFAEGTARPMFDSYLCIQNPGDVGAEVKTTYMLGDGTTVEEDDLVGPHSRSTIRVRDILGEGQDAAHDFSARVECTNGQMIVAERPIYFSYESIWSGGSDVVGIQEKYPVFYFAEGTTRPGFDSYLCIQNPENADANVRITYMLGDGTTQEESFTVGAQSRSTVRVNDALGEGNDPAHDFSARVECTNGKRIVAERPMYFNYHREWTGGHDTIGDLGLLGDACLPFYFAEGTTRPGFDSYLCIQNAADREAEVAVTYLLGDGNALEQKIEIEARSRHTVNVKDILGEGVDPSHDFSARVQCTNGRMIVVERPMYFSYKGMWTGGHVAMGGYPDTSFYFAEGTCRAEFEPYLCVMNPCLAHAKVEITFMLGDGSTRSETLEVDALSRSTVAIKDILGEGGDPSHDFSALVQSTNGIPVVAERSMYFYYQDKWTGGHNVVGL